MRPPPSVASPAPRGEGNSFDSLTWDSSRLACLESFIITISGSYIATSAFYVTSFRPPRVLSLNIKSVGSISYIVLIALPSTSKRRLAWGTPDCSRHAVKERDVHLCPTLPQPRIDSMFRALKSSILRVILQKRRVLEDYEILLHRQQLGSNVLNESTAGVWPFVHFWECH